jgi:hypothetical protein
MTQCGNMKTASEIKLTWAFNLISSGFIEMTEALAHIDQNIARGMLVAIQGRLARTVREGSASLSAKGYPRSELDEIAERLSQTMAAARQTTSAHREPAKKVA